MFNAALCPVNSSCGDDEKESFPALDFCQWAGFQPSISELKKFSVILGQGTLPFHFALSPAIWVLPPRLRGHEGEGKKEEIELEGSRVVLTPVLSISSVDLPWAGTNGASI